MGQKNQPHGRIVIFPGLKSSKHIPQCTRARYFPFLRLVDILALIHGDSIVAGGWYVSAVGESRRSGGGGQERNASRRNLTR